MQRLWTPWRLAYVSGSGETHRKGVPPELSGWPPEHDLKCVFCNMLAAVRWGVGAGMPIDEAERAALILKQDESSFICLNRYPYSPGHVLIVPFAHVASLSALDDFASAEMMSSAKKVEIATRNVYRPDGLNLGMNLGAAAGAGVAEHLHLHELPRWNGDTNFMTTTADTRVLPEDIMVTWTKLRYEITRVQTSLTMDH